MDADVIFNYTREEAIEDGVLVDVTDVAKEAGFRIPVAITAAIQADLENIPENRSFQSYDGRLWDLIWMASNAARMNSGKSTLLYDMHLDRVKGGHLKRKYRVRMVCGPGDNGEPVITLMKPNED